MKNEMVYQGKRPFGGNKITTQKQGTQIRKWNESNKRLGS